MQIDKSLVWIPCWGMMRDEIRAELIKDCSGYVDKGDHLWIVTVNNRGPMLFCYGLQVGEQDGKQTWMVKRIPEHAAPDVFDCPLHLLDMAPTVDRAWREEVRRWHEAHPAG